VLRSLLRPPHTPLTNEVGNSGSYAAGGGALTNVTPTTSGTTAFTDFDDLTFTSATITARGALIYNDTAAGDPSCCRAGLRHRQNVDRRGLPDCLPYRGCFDGHHPHCLKHAG
jgi:hypothetical protein